MVSPNFPSTHIAGRIISTDPLVTFSATNRAAPLGLMSVAPDLLGDRPGLHLLNHTWTLEDGDADWLSESAARAKDKYPDAHFVMLASNELEVECYSRMGESCILANTLCLTDESLFRPLPRSKEPEFDATYVGRLDGTKRHGLARLVPRLQLIYGYELESKGEGYRRTRELLPGAHFVNNETGAYRMLSAPEIVQRLSRSRVGLCLSAVEGNMRASMEYLLCGLAVVSRHSKGGRDRYFGTSYCRIVEDDPEAIAAAVSELRELNLDPFRIRQHVLQIIGFERHNLLAAINGLARKYLKHENLLPSITPLLGAPTDAVPSEALRARVDAKIRTAGPAAQARTRSPNTGTPRDPAYAVVLTTARSGTHMLRSILEQLPDLDCPGEVFNKDTGAHLPRHFVHYLQREMKHRRAFAMSDKVAIEILQGYLDYLRHTSQDTQTIVLDVEAHALRILDWPAMSLDGVPRLLDEMIRLNFAIIRLKRRNLLSQLASLELARRSGEWVRTATAGPVVASDQRVTLDVETLVPRLERNLGDEAQLDLWVGQARGTSVFYEDLVDPGDGTLRSAARQTLEDLFRTRLPQGLVPTTQKIAPGLPQLIANFDQVRERLRGTRFEEFVVSR